MKRILCILLFAVLLLLCGCRENDPDTILVRHDADTSGAESSTVSEPIEPSSGRYVVNASTKKIHLASCAYAQKMAESKRVYTDDPSEYEAEGYVFCATCAKELSKGHSSDTESDTSLPVDPVSPPSSDAADASDFVSSDLPSDNSSEHHSVDVFDDVSDKISDTTSEKTHLSYILNNNSKKIHLPTCSSVKQIKDKNRGETDDLTPYIAKGYTPCKICLKNYPNT